MTKVMEDLAEEKLWIPVVIAISYIGTCFVGLFLVSGLTYVYI